MAMTYDEKIRKYEKEKEKAKALRRKSEDNYEKAKYIKDNIVTKEEYMVYLRDYRWVNRRNYIKGIRGAVCMNCGKEHNLHVHHLNYEKYPWEASDNHLICLCDDCHKKAHSGEITNLSQLIIDFNNLPEDKDRVMCFKNNNYIGNYTLLEAEEKYSLDKKRIIKCCDGETATCGGYTWKYPKINQKIEYYEPYKSPSGTENYIDFTLGPNFNITSSELTKWESEFISSLYEFKTLTIKQKITLVKIINKLEYKNNAFRN